jgi:hypothetical protein
MVQYWSSCSMAILPAYLIYMLCCCGWCSCTCCGRAVARLGAAGHSILRLHHACSAAAHVRVVARGLCSSVRRYEHSWLWSAELPSLRKQGPLGSCVLQVRV